MPSDFQLLNNIAKQKGYCNLAVLVDPDKTKGKKLERLLHYASISNVDFLFVGGSNVKTPDIREVILHIKSESTIPTIIFPGDTNQVCKSADGMLMLSLISGRNPEYLIEKQVKIAEWIYQNELEVYPTGYILVNESNTSAVSRYSNTYPIPPSEKDLVVSTALAGQYLGMHNIYLEAGSGSQSNISLDIINSVSSRLSIPLIVGGGIKQPEAAYRIAKSGANTIVLGNVLEHSPEMILEFSSSIKIKVPT